MNDNRVELTWPLLMALGFKKHKVVIFDYHNYVKGDFFISEAMPRFVYKDEQLGEIKYLDELCKIYLDKTGEKLNLEIPY